ncbi:hypothetical protein [Demequina flava]|uniref:hypothetical protein n=1 Tax=Demequina flava TaxID=1095025 RepID=UPI000783A168|nr:hypothetical protein [Demequina flava]
MTTSITVAPVRTPVETPLAEPGLDVSKELDTWLETMVKPESPVRWRHRGRAPIPMSSATALESRVRLLSNQNDWGVVERRRAGEWAQTMHLPDGYIIEVNGVPGPHCFARRVQGVDGSEKFASAAVVADVLWSWLRISLPAGYSLRELSEGE